MGTLWRDDGLDVVAATERYGAWCLAMAGADRFDKAGLRRKHALMATSPFAFLRGSFYRWGWTLGAADGAIWDTPEVLAVGDIHVENFGSWRDPEGRLVWGVNDFDEAARLPFAVDLVRLALSARLLADKEDHAHVGAKEAAVLVITGYRKRIARRPRAYILEQKNTDLRELALDSLSDPETFWDRLTASYLDPADVHPEAVALLQGELPDNTSQIRFTGRDAGLGSRGRARIAIAGTWEGGWIAREAKAVLPSAVHLDTSPGDPPASAIRDLIALQGGASDPKTRVFPRWTIRRLSPETRKLDWDDLIEAQHWRHVLKAMGGALANLHGAQPEVEAIRRIAAGDRFEEDILAAAKLANKRLEDDFAAFAAAEADGRLP